MCVNNGRNHATRLYRSLTSVGQWDKSVCRAGKAGALEVTSTSRSWLASTLISYELVHLYNYVYIRLGKHFSGVSFFLPVHGAWIRKRHGPSCLSISTHAKKQHFLFVICPS